MKKRRKTFEPAPTISVIMPVRDGALHISESVNSIINQSYGDWELIIVDDGSSDSTPIITSSFKRKDNRIKVIRTDKQGAVAAANLAIAKSRGKWIARLDADDIAHPDRLEKQLAFTEQNGADVIGSKAEILSETQVKPGFQAYFDWANSLLTHEQMTDEFLSESPFIHSSIFGKREVFLKHPYQLEEGPEDYELWLRMLREGIKFAKIDETLVCWRYNQQGESRCFTTDTKIFAKVKLQHLLKTHLENKQRVLVQGAGHQGKMWLRLLLEKQVNVIGMLDVAQKRLGKKIEGVTVYHLDQIGELDFDFVISAVGQKGPNTKRVEVRQQLKDAELKELRDFVLVC